MELKLERQYAIQWVPTYSIESMCTSKVVKLKFKKKMKQHKLKLYNKVVLNLSVRAVDLNINDLQHKDLYNRMKYVDSNSGLTTEF